MDLKEMLEQPLSREEIKLLNLTKEFTNNQKEILSSDEYLDVLISVFGQYKEDSLHDSTQTSDSYALSRTSRGPFADYFTEKLRTLDPVDFKIELEKIFSRQKELIFISNGGNISASLLTQGFPAHWRVNDYFDVIYVFQGECRYYFPTITLNLRAGDFLIIPPEISHGEICISEDNKTISCAIRSSAFSQMFFNLFSDNAFLQSFFYRILSGDQSIEYLYFTTGSTDNTTDSVLDDLFFRLLEEQFSDQPYHHKMTDSFMSLIFVHLLRYYESCLLLPPTASFHWKAEYAEIFRYIAAHFTTVSLDELAQHFHYSRRQLMRIIQECTGTNFIQMIRAMKMQQAKDLLLETSLIVEEISLRCGYENLSSFSRVFSGYFGCTPTQMRKM